MQFETGTGVAHGKCMSEGCTVLLFWEDDGTVNAGEEFRACDCRCEFEERKVVCNRHKGIFICPDCHDY